LTIFHHLKLYMIKVFDHYSCFIISDKESKILNFMNIYVLVWNVPFYALMHPLWGLYYQSFGKFYHRLNFLYFLRFIVKFLFLFVFLCLLNFLNWIMWDRFSRLLLIIQNVMLCWVNLSFFFNHDIYSNL